MAAATRQISQVVRLCLYFGIAVLFTPMGEDNWPAETFNGLWAKEMGFTQTLFLPMPPSIRFDFHV